MKRARNNPNEVSSRSQTKLLYHICVNHVLLFCLTKHTLIYLTIQVLARSESCDVSLPVDNGPYWLAHMGEGHSVSFTVPQDRVINGMALCFVYLSTFEIVATECLRSVLIVNHTKCTLQIHNHGTVISFNDIDWQGIISNLESGDRVEIFLTFSQELVVKNTVVYLICGESNDIETKPVSKKNPLIRFIKNIV